jgi:hypothetical protein
VQPEVQPEELPDADTIATYLCPCQCEDDHENYELQPPRSPTRTGLRPTWAAPTATGASLARSSA